MGEGGGAGGVWGGGEGVLMVRVEGGQEVGGRGGEGEGEGWGVGLGDGQQGGPGRVWLLRSTLR